MIAARETPVQWRAPRLSRWLIISVDAPRKLRVASTSHAAENEWAEIRPKVSGPTITPRLVPTMVIPVAAAGELALTWVTA